MPRYPRKEKLHAKCYLTHRRSAVIGSYDLIGFSNFTFHDLNDWVDYLLMTTNWKVTIL